MPLQEIQSFVEEEEEEQILEVQALVYQQRWYAVVEVLKYM